MPRPTKRTVEYFPHYVTESKTKYLLEKRWGNNGYAFWFKLLEFLCRADGHAYCVKDPLDWEYFISIMGVDSNVANDIMGKLAEIGKIDIKLWDKHKTIWCPTLMEHIKFVYDKRSIDMPTKPKFEMCGSISDTETGVFGAETDVNGGFRGENSAFEPKTGVFGVDNPQMKVKVNENTPSISPPAPQGDENPPNKKAYGGEFQKVKLTDDEYGKLVERLGKDSAADYIDRLDGWLAEGHKKKNHYATILNWWRKDNPQTASEGSVKTNGPGFKPSRT